MTTLDKKIKDFADGVASSLAQTDLRAGLLDNLTTSDKSNLVAAVNEVNAKANAASNSTLPFTKEYKSGELTIDPGQGWQLEHGLGVVPKLLMLTLVCKVNDTFGYGVGEEISLDQVYTGIPYDYNVGIQSSASSTTIRTKVAPSGAGLTNINTGQPSIVNANNYRLIVRAWA